MRILLVEDERRLHDALVYILEKENYVVDSAYDGEVGESKALSGIYDVIVLDWMLPKQDGIDILKSIRENKIHSYIIFLTAKDTIEDRVMGLDGGADDYLIKPFSKNELLARIRALSRRVTTEIVEHQLIKIGNIVLDVRRCEYSYSMGYAERLTLQETQLLEYLITNKNQVLSKEQILDKIWGFEKDVEIGIVELYIHYLRKKIDMDKAGIEIKTIRGVGYTLLEVSYED